MDTISQYRATHRPAGRPQPRSSNQECIKRSRDLLKQMEAEGFSDEQLAAAVAAETGKPLSGPTFRRYFDRILRPVVLRPRRLRNSRAKADDVPRAVVIDHDPNDARRHLPTFNYSAEE